MNKTKYIQDITITRPDGTVIELELHESPTGGYFAIEIEFIEQQNYLADDAVSVDPFSGEKVILQDPEELDVKSDQQEST